jgi:hypothetical protein
MPHECFADEIAIDFPSAGRVIERIRDAFLGERVDADVVHAHVSLAPREAIAGRVLSVDVPVRTTCLHCGGRGETWSELCTLCGGSGESTFSRPVRVRLPGGVTNGACVRFRLTSPDAPSIRVEIRIAVRSSAA